MKISLHGGHCCGIKTIYDLGWSPENTAYRKSESSKKYLSADRNGGQFDTDWDMYWPERPSEKMGERFKAYINYLAEIRRYGLVEVAIIVPCIRTECLSDTPMYLLENQKVSTFEEAVAAAGSYYDEDDDETYTEGYSEGGGRSWWTQEEWIPVLEKHGFKMVSEFPNINSGNLIQVWHLVMNGEYHKQRKGK